MKTLKLLFHILFILANIVVVILFILSAFSDEVPPTDALFFAYLGLAFPIFFVLSLCFILYWSFRRKWKYALLGVCALLICKDQVKSYFPIHKRVKETELRKDDLKVLTYNVMGFAYRNHTQNAPNPILEYIAQSGADIVCLQEYAASKSEKLLTDQKIFDALPMYPYHSVIPFGTSGQMKFGIAVFSKYPITGSRRIRYKSGFNGSSLHQIEVKGKKIALINNHLESFKLTSEDRSRYSAFIKNLNADTFDGLRSAFEQKLGPAFRIRAVQAEAVAKEIEQIKAPYMVVCGDFNDTPVSYAHKTIQGPLTDAYAASGRGPGITYNQNFFWFRIDNIMHSSNIKSMNCTVDKVRYSDHYPMWCYIRLTE